MSKTKSYSFDWKSFFAGGWLTAMVLVLVYIFALSPDKVSTDVVESTEVAANVETNVEQNTYNTDIKEWNLKTTSGEEIKLYTPDKYYSLSDQYLESLAEYYGLEEIKSDSIAVIGNSTSTYTSDTIINVDTISDVSNMLAQVYGEELTEKDVVESEAYVYMKTGELPEDVPDNYTIEEVNKYTVDGVTYTAYEVNYDTTYTNESEDDTDTEAESTVVHTQQIACYSDTEDAVEIIIYQESFDRDYAITILKELLGVE